MCDIAQSLLQARFKAAENRCFFDHGLSHIVSRVLTQLLWPWALPSTPRSMWCTTLADYGSIFESQSGFIWLEENLVRLWIERLVASSYQVSQLWQGICHMHTPILDYKRTSVRYYSMESRSSVASKWAARLHLEEAIEMKGPSSATNRHKRHKSSTSILARVTNTCSHPDAEADV